MSIIWGVHNDRSELDLVEGGFISIGWDELGDLSGAPVDREDLKRRLIAAYPQAKPGAIPVWAGVLARFMEEMQVGDFVVCPNKSDRTLSIGQVAGDYYSDPSALMHRNRRKVTWIRTGVPRAELPTSALHEIGSAVTLFRVKRHVADIMRLIDGSADGDEISDPLHFEDETEVVEDEPSAARVDAYTKDFVAEVLQHMDPYRFEHLVAGLLKALGYRAEVTQQSGDGGVDVIASRDMLRLSPPTIKVQCKRTSNPVGAPAVQALLGTLAQGGNELALFVTLGNYSNEALHIGRTRQDLRLLSGKELIDLVLEHYDNLDPEWQREIPLRRVYAVDRDMLA